eukprot:1183075-Prorocentrum_minimum.AAC.3
MSTSKYPTWEQIREQKRLAKEKAELQAKNERKNIKDLRARIAREHEFRDTSEPSMPPEDDGKKIQGSPYPQHHMHHSTNSNSVAFLNTIISNSERVSSLARAKGYGRTDP